MTLDPTQGGRDKPEAVARLEMNYSESEIKEIADYFRADLKAALVDAIEGMEDMIAYVDKYFQEKWDHQGYIDRAREATK